jgi:hypothetical protein
MAEVTTATAQIGRVMAYIGMATVDLAQNTFQQMTLPSQLWHFLDRSKRQLMTLHRRKPSQPRLLGEDQEITESNL